VNSVFEIPLSDVAALRDRAKEFAKEERYREALILGEKQVSLHNYDKVHQLIEGARTSVNGNGDVVGLTWETLPRFDPDAVKSTKWLVEGLFAERTLSLIYGPRGSFKSSLMLACGGAVSRGEDFLEMKTRRRKVLYLDYENPADVIKNRVRDLRLNLPENENLVIWDRFNGRAVPRPGDPMLEQFIAHCLEEFDRSPWIIFDSLSSVLKLGEGGETTGQTAPIFAAILKLRDMGATISVLDHTRKYDPGVIYGGQDKEAKADTIHNFTLHKTATRPEHPTVSVQSWLKRYAPQGVGDFAVEVQSSRDDNKRWHVTGFRPTGNPVVEEKKRYRHILQDLIRDNPDASQRELANLAAERDGFARDRAEARLKAGIGKYWTVTKGKGRKLGYKLLED